MNFNSKFCIPLDFEILESSLPLYQCGLGSHLTYELTFADYFDVIKAMDPDATYTISNISLEFDTIINASLASQIRTKYMKSRILYDRILRENDVISDKDERNRLKKCLQDRPYSKLILKCYQPTGYHLL